MAGLTRREFGSALATLGAGAALAGEALAGDAARPRLAVSTWSFHNYFPNTRYGQPQFRLEEWRVEDVLRRAKQGLEIDAFELSTAHLRATTPAALDELKAFAREERCQLVHLSDNVRGLNLAQPDAQRRQEAERTFEGLIDVAQRLGIPTMRVNTGTPPQGAMWDLDVTIGSYRRLARYGRERNVEIVIENHFGISADPRNVARIIEAVGENISSCPDFGLFTRDEDRWPGLTTMFRHCRRIVSAKYHGLGEDDAHAAFDLRRCWRVMGEARFAGWASLEYEGNLEPLPQLQRMARLARRWLAE